MTRDPYDEQTITVVHEPNRTFRRAVFVMFVVMGLLVFAVFRIAGDSNDRVRDAQRQNQQAIDQNAELQRTLDELVRAETADDAEQRARSERSVAFIAAILANSTDPVLREAARDALADLQANTPGALPPVISPRAAPPASREPASQPPQSPPPAPPNTEEPAPSPEPEPGPVEQVTETVDETLCAVLPTC